MDRIYFKVKNMVHQAFEKVRCQQNFSDSTSSFSELPQYCSCSQMPIYFLLPVIRSIPQCVLEYRNACMCFSISNYKNSNSHVMLTLNIKLLFKYQLPKTWRSWWQWQKSNKTITISLFRMTARHMPTYKR